MSRESGSRAFPKLSKQKVSLLGLRGSNGSIPSQTQALPQAVHPAPAVQARRILPPPPLEADASSPPVVAVPSVPVAAKPAQSTMPVPGAAKLPEPTVAQSPVAIAAIPSAPKLPPPTVVQSPVATAPVPVAAKLAKLTIAQSPVTVAAAPNVPVVAKPAEVHARSPAVPESTLEAAENAAAIAAEKARFEAARLHALAREAQLEAERQASALRESATSAEEADRLADKEAQKQMDEMRASEQQAADIDPAAPVARKVVTEAASHNESPDDDPLPWQEEPPKIDAKLILPDIDSVDWSAFDSLEPFLLKELKGKRFRYVVNVGNSGDALIQYGTLLLFDKLGLDYEIVQPIDRQTGQLLVYAGAGNLVQGMDYKECSFFLELNAKPAMKNTIILLPATIRGFEEQLKNLGSNVIIFTREPASYKHVKSVATDARVYLSKDMAFYIKDLDPELARMQKEAFTRRGTTEKVGLVLRTDNENPDNTYIPPYNRDLSMLGRVQFDRKDPSQNQETVKKSIVKVSHALFDELSQYSQIWTNRLHICIAGALMKLDSVHCMDNRYGKVWDVYNYSMVNRFTNIRWAGDPTKQPWINAITLDPPNGAWMCLSSAPGLNSSWCANAAPRDGYEFLYNDGATKFCGDCECCYRRQGLPLNSTGCFATGNSPIVRDSACAGDLVCARHGYDNREYGCSEKHCCSKAPHPRPSAALLMLENNFHKTEVHRIQTRSEKKKAALLQRLSSTLYKSLPPSSLTPEDATRWINIGIFSMLFIRLLRWKIGGDMLERLTFFLDLMVWYVGTAIYLSTSQKLLETCDSSSIITVALVQVFAGTSLVPICDTGKVTRFSRHLLTILAIGGCAFYFGVYFSLHGQARTGILFTSNVRALEPFFTTFLMTLLAGESLTSWQYLSILVAVFGVILAATEFSSATLSTLMSGELVELGALANFTLLCAANLVYSTRNIIFHQTAQLAKHVLPSPITLFMVSAVMSLPFAGLLFFVNNFPAPTIDITSQLVGFDAELLLISSAAFVLYNVASFFILMRVTPTEHAVLLTGKRLVTVLFACFLSGQLPNMKQVLSLTITAGAVGSFEMEKRRKKDTSTSDTKQSKEKPEATLDLAEQYLADLAQHEVLDLPDEVNQSDENVVERMTHMKRILLSRVGAPIFLVLFTTACMGIPASLTL